MIEKGRQPLAQPREMTAGIGELLLARVRTGMIEHVAGLFEPGLLDVRGDLGMKLQTIGAAVAKRLVLEGLPRGKQLCRAGRLEALEVPVVHHEVLRNERPPGLRRRDRVEADLAQALLVRSDRTAQGMGQQLAAETNAKQRLVCSEPVFDPLQLVAQVIQFTRLLDHLSTAIDHGRVESFLWRQGLAFGDIYRLKLKITLSQLTGHTIAPCIRHMPDQKYLSSHSFLSLPVHAPDMRPQLTSASGAAA